MSIVMKCDDSGENGFVIVDHERNDAVFRIGAVKPGMLANKQVIDAVADALERHRPAFIVLDPVMNIDAQRSATRSQNNSWCCITLAKSRRGGASTIPSFSKRTFRTWSPPIRLASDAASTRVDSVSPSNV